MTIISWLLPDKVMVWFLVNAAILFSYNYSREHGRVIIEKTWKGAYGIANQNIEKVLKSKKD